MAEKLVMVNWNFVELKCGYEHRSNNGKEYNPPMEVKQGHEGTYYDCPDEHCINRIPMLAYEKIINEAMRIINEGYAERGYTWTMKSSRQMYELTVFNYKPDVKIVIGVKNLTIRKR